MKMSVNTKKRSYIQFDAAQWQDITQSGKYSLRTIGKLMISSAKYLKTGEEPDFREFPELSVIWDSFKRQLRLVNP